MNGVERIVGMRMNKGKRLTGGIGKLLLYHECSRQLVALVNIVVYDKPIQLRTQRDRTQHCGDYQLKYIILIAVVTLITPRKIILGSAQIELLRDKSLIIRTVRQNMRHNYMH